MNTKVKVAVAAVIVAVLVALIVLDQKTLVHEPAATAPPSSDVNVTLLGGPSAPAADQAAERARASDIEFLMNSRERIPAPAPTDTLKNPEKETQKTIAIPVAEEYVIKEGDTYETIALQHYGSKSFASLVADANPGMRPTALKVGKTLTLPPKPEKRVETSVVIQDPAAAPAPAPKSYTVVSGDTLSGISTKLFKTSRHYQKIYEANRGLISDPNSLTVGMQLTIPELPAKVSAPVGGTVPVAAVVPPAGAKVHQVQPSDSLWRIAEKYASEKGVGILQMMEAIAGANSDKIKDKGTLLQLGWQLIIPD